MKKRKKLLPAVTIAVALIAGFGLLGFNTFRAQWRAPKNTAGSGGGEKAPCINPALPIPEQYHIHPHLRIVADGKDVPVPANIGLSIGCERVLHTHDQTGAIHIEPNFYQEFTLGDFFGVWEKPFDRDRVLDYARDPSREIVMTVDGKPDDSYERLVLKDKQEIVIEYRAIEAVSIKL